MHISRQASNPWSCPTTLNICLHKPHFLGFCLLSHKVKVRKPTSQHRDMVMATRRPENTNQPGENHIYTKKSSILVKTKDLRLRS